MKAFKGFNKDLTCRGYQYEEGKEFHTERAECCDTGFHACEYPLDCFGYYDPAHSVYHEVELSGEMDKSGDNTKVCATEIGVSCGDCPRLYPLSLNAHLFHVLPNSTLRNSFSCFA